MACFTISERLTAAKQLKHLIIIIVVNVDMVIVSPATHTLTWGKSKMGTVWREMSGMHLGGLGLPQMMQMNGPLEDVPITNIFSFSQSMDALVGISGAITKKSIAPPLSRYPDKHFGAEI